MIQSKDLSDLRPDVAPNARLWLADCHAQGLDVMITNTLRDNEYQAWLYEQGRTRPGSIVTNGKTTTFHGAGLAIDFHSKSKGWSEHSFFVSAAQVAKKYGFSWSGDWKKFVEYAHIQWDNHGKSTYKNAPTMPLYQEEDDMTEKEVRAIANELIAAKNTVYQDLASVPEWGKATVQKLITRGAITGTGAGLDMSYEQLRTLVINDRMGLYGAEK